MTVDETKPVDQQAFKPPRWFWFIWSSIFLLVGSVFLYVLTIRPLWSIGRAADWAATPCTVVSSELKMEPSTDAGSPGPTYSIEIVFHYRYGDRDYQCDRYDFVTMSSNTSVGTKERVVRTHPPGMRTTCYVNPNDPSEAVLNRGLTNEMWWGLFPIPFVV